MRPPQVPDPAELVHFAATHSLAFGSAVHGGVAGLQWCRASPVSLARRDIFASDSCRAQKQTLVLLLQSWTTSRRRSRGWAWWWSSCMPESAHGQFEVVTRYTSALKVPVVAYAGPAYEAELVVSSPDAECPAHVGPAHEWCLDWTGDRSCDRQPLRHPIIVPAALLQHS